MSKNQLDDSAVPDRTIPVVEERFRVEKEPVTTGRVRVSTRTKEFEERVRVPIAQCDVEVTRVPVGREVEAAPDIQVEGDVTIVPVLEEVLVVEKRLFLKEEIHIRRVVVRENVEVPVTLRKQEMDLERLDAQGDHAKLTEQRKHR